MYTFTKTRESAICDSPLDVVCVACKCKTYVLCDTWQYAYAPGISAGIEENNWRHPGIGDEYDGVPDPFM